MRNRLIGLSIEIDTDPTGWTTIVLVEHVPLFTIHTRQRVVRASLRTNATARPGALAEIVGPTLIEEAFWTGLAASPPPTEN